MNRMKQKLKCNSGLTLLLAMILLLVAVTISAVVLTTAVSSVEATKSDREGEQAYLTVSSAVEMFKDGLGSCQGEVKYEVSGEPVSFSLLSDDEQKLVNAFKDIKGFRLSARDEFESIKNNSRLLKLLGLGDIITSVERIEEEFTKNKFPEKLVYSSNVNDLFRSGVTSGESTPKSVLESHFQSGDLFNLDLDVQETIAGEIKDTIKTDLVGNLNTEGMGELYSKTSGNEGDSTHGAVEITSENENNQIEALVKHLTPQNVDANIVTDNFVPFLEAAVGYCDSIDANNTDTVSYAVTYEDTLTIKMGQMDPVKVAFRMEKSPDDETHSDGSYVESYTIRAVFSLAEPDGHDCKMTLTTTLRKTVYPETEKGESTETEEATPTTVEELPDDLQVYYCVTVAAYTIDLDKMATDMGMGVPALKDAIQTALKLSVNSVGTYFSPADLFSNVEGNIYRVYFPTDMQVVAYKVSQKVTSGSGTSGSRVYNMEAVNTRIVKGEDVT